MIWFDFFWVGLWGGMSLGLWRSEDSFGESSPLSPPGHGSLFCCFCRTVHSRVAGPWAPKQLSFPLYPTVGVLGLQTDTLGSASLPGRPRGQLQGWAALWVLLLFEPSCYSSALLLLLFIVLRSRFLCCRLSFNLNPPPLTSEGDGTYRCVLLSWAQFKIDAFFLELFLSILTGVGWGQGGICRGRRLPVLRTGVAKVVNFLTWVLGT